MAIPIKLRAGNGGIKILISHPSENGQRKDKSGAFIPASFIKNISVAMNGKTVLDGQWGGGVSKDPYLSFKVKGMKTGDKISVSIEDNYGGKSSIDGSAS